MSLNTSASKQKKRTPFKVHNHHRRLIFPAIAFVQSAREGNRKFINKLKEREAFN